MHQTDSCRCCGLIQIVPSVTPPTMKAACARCGTALRGRNLSGDQDLRLTETAAIALAALILYPLAVTLPMLKVQQFGHHTETSVLGGVANLLADGQIVVGLIVLLCSIVFPVGKLLSILVLTIGGLGMAHHHKAATYRLIEWTGRWGMLDVLLVAILVAALKLGDVMDVTPGPAAAAFAICVALSLLASAMFDPRTLWEREA